jgi:hypothetical protein
LADTNAAAALPRWVVAWRDSQKGVYEFFWIQPQQVGDQERQESAGPGRLFVSAHGLAPADLVLEIVGARHERILDGRLLPHPGFSIAMAKSSGLAHLLVVESGQAGVALEWASAVWHSLQASLDESNPHTAAWTLGQQPAIVAGPFARAARSLGSGEDRRMLQMAVQYLANGGVDDSLVAAEYDKAFIDGVRSDLEKRKH